MTGHRRRFIRLAIALAAVMPLAPAAYAQTQPRVLAAGLSSSLEDAARMAGPAVVEIFATSYAPRQGVVPNAADLVTRQRASGSGVIVDPDGYIVTNAHVVQGAHQLQVELSAPSGGQSILASRRRVVRGEVIGIDLETDLAVIKVDGRSLPAMAFGDSDALRPGQIVLAVGSPLGLYNSVSFGVVSSIARQLEPESPMVYVQTDASINPGSSGGPLVDLNGRLVGINTMIVSQAGGNEGLGFAAPANIVRAVYAQIRQFGRVRRGDIGLRAQTITPVLAAGLDLPRTDGVVVADVTPDSPAARAGIRPGDLVMALDGKAMENGRQLHVGLYRRFVGDIVTLDVLRAGQVQTLPVAMMEREDPFAAILVPPDPRDHLVSRLGILAMTLDPRIADALPALRVRSGVVVMSTVAGAIDSREGGLAAGDVVHAVNRTPVTGLAELRAALDRLKTGDPVVLQLERRGELMFLAFTAE